MSNRIGVFGGSFDPLHYGHLILCEQIRQLADLKEVVIMPAYVNPFKQENYPASGLHRLNMIKAAVEGHSDFSVSDIEIKRENPSYTYKTLCELRELYPEGTEICFIMGTDAFLDIEAWNCSDKLLSEFSFIIGLRKGYNEEKLINTIEDLKTRYPLKAEYYRIPDLEISSSDIKAQFLEGKSVRFLLPDSIIKYMRKNCVYQSLKDQLKNYARTHEKPSRFKHTEGVVKMAIEMALRFGEDPEKAEIAAWAHDIAKPAGALEHGAAAAEILINEFGLEDEDILNAVRYHTTGRAGMSGLEKVMKIADQLEENRDFEGVDELRKTTSGDIDRCVYEIIKSSKKFVLSQGKTFDSKSDEALKYFEELIAEKGV